MATFTITYDTGHPGAPDRETETVEASSFSDNGDWIDFRKMTSGGPQRVLRVRADHVSRVERTGD